MTISAGKDSVPAVEQFVKELVRCGGDDPDREGLKDTPARFVAAWKHWTSGYRGDPALVLKCFEDGGEKYDALVFQGGIPLYSLCEHHLAPFFGIVHVGYIPSGKIVGLSKLSRLVDIFARRLQVQERITSQIADALLENLEPRAVGVVAQCRHLCMESRGVQKPGVVTTTSALRGEFRVEPEARAEFFSMVSSSQQVHIL